MVFLLYLYADFPTASTHMNESKIMLPNASELLEASRLELRALMIDTNEKVSNMLDIINPKRVDERTKVTFVPTPQKPKPITYTITTANNPKGRLIENIGETLAVSTIGAGIAGLMTIGTTIPALPLMGTTFLLGIGIGLLFSVGYYIVDSLIS